ncbi:hypothetical protein ACFQRB_16955 [Halobaculum litoreum]|uniref:Uncharacterized protein n=1 Tax=Halobaculum litoreum TaxID=3031998 RepID=A0ABD5XWV6_9EURY
MSGWEGVDRLFDEAQARLGGQGVRTGVIGGAFERVGDEVVEGADPELGRGGELAPRPADT